MKGNEEKLQETKLASEVEIKPEEDKSDVSEAKESATEEKDIKEENKAEEKHQWKQERAYNKRSFKAVHNPLAKRGVFDSLKIDLHFKPPVLSDYIIL